MALQAFKDKDRDLAQEVCAVESEFDNMYLKARQKHIRRLETGVCNAQADIIFTESLRLLERISDHADNIGVSVMRN
jgi:phosphate:Na+ symporter